MTDTLITIDDHGLCSHLWSIHESLIIFAHANVILAILPIIIVPHQLKFCGGVNIVVEEPWSGIVTMAGRDGVEMVFTAEHMGIDGDRR